MKKSTVKREEMVQFLAQTGDLTYVQAERAYAAFMQLLANAMAGKCRVNFAKIGTLEPVDHPPRRVVMGFKREEGRVEKTKREYWVGARTRYAFKTYRVFAENHGLAS